MAKLYMVPSVISEEGEGEIPQATLEVIQGLKFYIAERARTARRFLKLCKLPFSIQEIEIVEMDKRDFKVGKEEVLQWLKDGHDVGVISESGMPGVADPGREFAKLAHNNNFEVIPLTGPSSIFLALSASGLSGQDFCFHGYLPIKDHELKSKFKELKKNMSRGQTQIFIETPYRNSRMFEQILKNFEGNDHLCLAIDVTGKNQSIQTRKINQWNGAKPKFDKIPTVFLLAK